MALVLSDQLRLAPSTEAAVLGVVVGKGRVDDPRLVGRVDGAVREMGARIGLAVPDAEVRVGHPGHAAGEFLEQFVLGLHRPGVGDQPEHHRVLQAAPLHALSQLVEQRFPERLGRGVGERFQIDQLGRARGGVEHRNAGPGALQTLAGFDHLRELPGVGECPLDLLLGAKVDIPDDEADDLGPPHVFLGNVQVPLHHREIVLVAVTPLLDPADHRLLVAQVRAGDQRHVEDAATHLVQKIHRAGDHPQVLGRPRFQAVLDGQRVG